MRLAWQHRFIVVFVGGGCTGVVQTNDTHLHAPLSSGYVELEQAAMFSAMSLDPDGCPSRTRRACLRDLATLWKRPAIHRRSSAGFWENMLSNALDGSEDHWASSEVAAFWQELNMSVLRGHCVDEVCAEFEAGHFDWSFEARGIPIDRPHGLLRLWARG